MAGSGGLWVSSARMVTFSDDNLSQVRRRAKHQPVNEPARSSGVQLHITSLPGGHARSRGLPVRRLAGRRRAALVAGAAAGAARPLPLAVQVAARRSRPGRGCWPTARAPVTAAEVLDFRERHAFWIAVVGALLGARGGARPGPLRTRVERAARLRRAARRAAVRRRRRSTSSPGGADERFWPELFSDGLRGGRAARRLLGRRAAVGQPAVRLAGAAPAPATAGGWSGSGGRCRCSTWRGSTTSAGFVSYWAVPEGARDRRRRPLAPRARARAVPGDRAFAGCWRRCRPGLVGAAVAAAGRRGPRRDHRAGRAAARSLGMPGMLVIQFGLDPDEPTSPHRLENHAADRIVYTATHDQDTARGWLESLAAAAAGVRRRRARPPRGRGSRVSRGGG